jgi:3-dehydroquinate dehydratase-1
MKEKKTVRAGKLVLGDGTPKICIPVTGQTEGEIAEQARKAVSAAPDLIEWRADFFAGIQDRAAAGEVLETLHGICGAIPLLFTFRTAAEGGQQELSAEAYRELNLWAASRPETALIDVEGRKGGLDAAGLITGIRREGKPSVASCHFFERTPDREAMLQVLDALERTGADVLKLAVMPLSPGDVTELLAVTVEMDGRTEKPLITMSMGRLGAVSRVCGRLTGSALTFGTAGRESAPGQLPAEELRRMLEWL